MEQMMVPPLANEGNEQVAISQSPTKRARRTDKRSAMEAKRLRDEEDRVKFAGKTASEKAAILVLTAEKVKLSLNKSLRNNFSKTFVLCL